MTTLPPNLPNFNIAGQPMPAPEPAPPGPPPMQMVEVTNHNNFVIIDHFDGVPYRFRPNEPLSIPPAAANHFFGWPGEGEHMRLHTCRRMGWNTPDHLERDKNRPHDQRTVADIYFEGLDLKTVQYDVVKRETTKVPMPEDSDLAERPELDQHAAALGGDRPESAGGDPTGETRMGFGRHAKKVNV